MNAINLFKKRSRGYALATILILMGVALFGVGAIITVSTLESKISRSHQEGTKAYYVAEAGVQDALWRLRNTPSYVTSLANGSLNITYHSRSQSGELLINNTTSDRPALGTGFTVKLISTSAHYAKIEATGFSDNQSFRARRQISTNVFQGATTGLTDSNALMTGGSMTVTNNSTLTLTGGDWYSSGPIIINSAAVNAGSNKIKTSSTYTANSAATVTSGGIRSSNHPPQPASGTVPNFNFGYYLSNNNASYSPSAFRNIVRDGGSVINFPGPVTYVSSDLALGNWARNKTINITGMLIIKGTFTQPSASGLKINIIDPGTGKAGIFTEKKFTNNLGIWNIDGVIYTAGDYDFSNNESVTVNGAVIAAGTLSVNTGPSITINYNASRVENSLDIPGEYAVGVEHWEEEY